MVKALHIAAELERDTVAASQVKEHIAPNRLREIMRLQFSNEELLDELEARLHRTESNLKLLEKLTKQLT